MYLFIFFCFLSVALGWLWFQSCIEKELIHTLWNGLYILTFETGVLFVFYQNFWAQTPFEWYWNCVSVLCFFGLFLIDWSIDCFFENRLINEDL